MSNMSVALEKPNDSKKHIVIENWLTVLVSLFAVSIYFSKTGLSVFGGAAILLMLYWRFVPGYVQKPSVPRAVIICFSLYFLDLLFSSAMSINSRWALSELGKYRYLLFGGLLFSAPLSTKNRNICLIVFLISASLDGLTGLLQYIDIQYWKSGIVFWTREYGRPLGNSSDQILYAANLALAFGAAITVLFANHTVFTTRKGKAALLIFLLVTITGVVVSESRGVWVALVPACLIGLLNHNWKNALGVMSAFLLMAMVLFVANTHITQRAATIATSAYAEDEKGSTGNRIELWKGALLMFKQSPVFGIGAGDFQSTIKQYIAEKKLKDVPATNTAHCIYLQVLATRGIIGISLLIAFFASLVFWGIKEKREGNKFGALVILISSLLAILGGFTENHIEVHRYLAAFGFTIGLMGPYGRAELNAPHA